MKYLLILLIVVPTTLFGQDSLKNDKIDLRYCFEKEHDKMRIANVFIGAGLMFTCSEYFIFSKERKNDGTPYDTRYLRKLGMGCVAVGLTLQIHSFHRINKKKKRS